MTLSAASATASGWLRRSHCPAAAAATRVASHGGRRTGRLRVSHGGPGPGHLPRQCRSRRWPGGASKPPLPACHAGALTGIGPGTAAGASRPLSYGRPSGGPRAPDAGAALALASRGPAAAGGRAAGDAKLERRLRDRIFLT
jgi:hypothetical protein